MYFNNGTAQIYYNDINSGEDSVLIFIHGFPLDHTMWEKSISYFIKNHRVIAFDMRSSGLSQSPEYPFTFEFMVDDLFKLMDHLSLKKAVLIGLSMGGYLALRAAQRDLQRFSGFIFCDTQTNPDNNQSLLGRYQNIKLVTQSGMDAFCEKFIINSLSKKTIRDNADALQCYRNITRNQAVQSIVQSLLAIATRTDTSDVLKSIDVPVLCVVGEEDRLTPVDVVKNMAEEIKNAQFSIIPDSAHMSAMENPDFFNRVMENFLTTNHL